MATKPMLRPMQIRIPDAARRWLKTQAEAQERSVNWFINQLIERAQKQKEAQHG
jgi:predicted HicB family RNase H-like nuclease